MGVKYLDFVFRKIFNVDEPIAGALKRGDNFVELQVNGQRIFVLAALNQKHHQECNDCCPGVDNQLPSVRKFKQWPCSYPDNNHRTSEYESGRCSGRLRSLAREAL